MSAAWELSGSPLPRRYKPGDSDFFIEPKWVVDLLLDAELFDGLVYDPACGIGMIVDACAARGFTAYGSDIAYRDPRFAMADFLDFSGQAENIICNPPYGLAEKFIEKALAITTYKVAMLVQSKFPYSQKRYSLFTEHPPAKVYFLSTRPSMPPGELLLAGTVKRGGGKLDYCWIVWYRGHNGNPECGWLKRSSR
jgi:hypothetical protein